jgi:ApeA N-terminal domain 1
MAYLSLTKTLEHYADWSIPDRAGVQVSGHLKYSADRIEVNLSNAFTPLSGEVAVSDIRPVYPVVHGVSSTGDALTILKAQSFGIGLNFGSGGMRQPERLISSWLIVGAHIEPDQLFSSVSFFIPGLEVWLCKPRITQTFQTDTSTGKMTQLFALHPAAPELTVVPSINATIACGAGTTSSVNPFKSISLEVQGQLTIMPNTPKTIEWFLDQHGKLSTMLAFLAGKPMPVDAIHAYLEGEARPVSLLVSMRQSERFDFKNITDFFVPCNSLKIELSTVVSNWFEKVESVLIPSQLALGIVSTKNLWLHIEFLSLIQALEGFHRGSYLGTYMDDSAYSKVNSVLCGAIPTSVATDHREALKSRIKYGNQISLSKRLNELRDILGESLAKIVLATSGKIPRSWIDTRNYHTHWDEELRPRAIDGQDMYNANVRMEHFLRVLYLLLMGIDRDTVINCLGNGSDVSQQLIQLNIIARRESDSNQPAGVIMTIGNLPSSVPNSPDSYAPFKEDKTTEDEQPQAGEPQNKSK